MYLFLVGFFPIPGRFGAGGGGSASPREDGIAVEGRGGVPEAELAFGAPVELALFINGGGMVLDVRGGAAEAGRGAGAKPAGEAVCARGGGGVAVPEVEETSPACTSSSHNVHA